MSKKGIFLGRGDRSIDCLSWYLSPDGGIVGYDKKEQSMWKHESCLYDPKEYFPDKVREKALEILGRKLEYEKCANGPSPMWPDRPQCPNKPVRYLCGTPYCQECAERF
jgi:hypothetical protein